MSDSYISIVPEEIEKSEATSLANRVIKELQSAGIISEKLTDCVLGGKGYSPGNNFQSAVETATDDLTDLLINGVEVIIEKTVFDSGSNGLEGINCPSCDHDIIELNWDEAISKWYEGQDDEVPCPSCKSVRSITKYNFHPTWSFGNLGFKFWNWPPLKTSFISHLEETLGKEVKVVIGKI